MDLYGETNIVSGVVTQGSPPVHDQWVNSFKVRVGVVECNLTYIVDSDNAPMVSTDLFHLFDTLHTANEMLNMRPGATVTIFNFCLQSLSNSEEREMSV